MTSLPEAGQRVLPRLLARCSSGEQAVELAEHGGPQPGGEQDRNAGGDESGDEHIFNCDDTLLGLRGGLGRVLLHEIVHVCADSFIGIPTPAVGWVGATLRTSATAEINKFDEIAGAVPSYSCRHVDASFRPSPRAQCSRRLALRA